MPDKIEGLFTGDQPPTGDDNFIDGDVDKPGLNQLVNSLNASLEYLKFFVGSTLDEPTLSMNSSGGTITISIQKEGGGDIRYRTVDKTETLVCDPTPQTVDLTPGTDSSPLSNYVYIDHATNDVLVNTTGFPESPHSSLAEYHARSALFHETHGILGKNHKNHVFTPGDNGHMEHQNEARRKQPCVFENGLLLTSSGSGTATVNFALSAGQLYRMHLHDVSGISSPAEFFINNDETTPDDLETNLHNITTYSDGSSNLNEYCIYILFVAYLGTTTGLFLRKSSAGYNSEGEAYTDPDNTANWQVPQAYIGASIYVGRVIARRTASTTTIYEINTDIRGLNPSAIAGGGLSGVPDHGSSHTDADPIPATGAGFFAASGAGSFVEKTIVESKTLLEIDNVDNTSDANKPISTATQTALDGKESTVTGGTTDQYYRGDKSWQDLFTQVRATTLTGLNTGLTGLVTAADTVLQAFGRLQNQITGIGFRGNVTVAQRDALTGLSAGDWVKVTDWDYRTEVYNGTFWLAKGHRVLENATGEVSVKGKSIIISTTSDFTANLPEEERDEDVIGVIVTAGVANGSDIVVAVSGMAEILMEANDDTGSGQYIGAAGTNGENYSFTTAVTGSFAKAYESKDDTSAFLVRGEMIVVSETV